MTPDEIAALSALCHPDEPWSPEAVRRHVAQRTSLVLTHEKDAVLVAHHVAPEAEILMIDVHPLRRRRGIARALLGELKAVADIIHLEVAADNAAAVALYRSAGFVETGRRRGYYARTGGPSVDALTMTWRAMPQRPSA